MAARMILGDWNTGKIKYFTHPPEQSSPESFLGAEIVEQFASEFDLKDLDNKMDLNELPNVKPRGFIQVSLIKNIFFDFAAPNQMYIFLLIFKLLIEGLVEKRYTILIVL